MSTTNIGVVQALKTEIKKRQNIGVIQTIPDSINIPVLSTPIVKPVTTTSISANVSTNTKEGIIWRYVSLTNIEPSISDLKHGIGSIVADSHNITTNGVQEFPNVVGLEDGILYYVFFYQEDNSGNGSMVINTSGNTLLTINFTNTSGFNANTYYAHMLHKNLDEINSNIVSDSAVIDYTTVLSTASSTGLSTVTGSSSGAVTLKTYDLQLSITLTEVNNSFDIKAEGSLTEK